MKRDHHNIKALLWGSLGVFMGLMSVQLAQGQDISGPELLRQRQARLEAFRTQFIPDDRSLKNGKEYAYFYSQVKGTHYYQSSDNNGSLKYDGSWYKDQLLTYDILNDLLVISVKGEQSQRYLIVNPYKLEEFEMLGDKFRNLRASQDSMMRPGIYQVAYEKGALTYYIKHRKETKLDTYAYVRSRMYRFISSQTHYLVVNGKAHVLKGKRDLFHALGKDEGVKEFIQKNKLRLGTDREDFTRNIIQVLEYYHSEQQAYLPTESGHRIFHLGALIREDTTKKRTATVVSGFLWPLAIGL